MLMGFILHFYIIFGTNLLTQGPVQIKFFCLFQCFAEKEYQTESKQNKTFGRVIFGTSVILGLGVDVKQPIRRPRGRGAPTLLGAPSPSWLNRPTSSSYICSHTPKTSRSTTKPYFNSRNLLYPGDPILGPFPELRRRGIDQGGLLHPHHSLSDYV